MLTFNRLSRCCCLLIRLWFADNLFRRLRNSIFLLSSAVSWKQKNKIIKLSLFSFHLCVSCFLRIPPYKVYLSSLQLVLSALSLRKHAYSNRLKTWKFSDKNSDIFHIYDQNIDCGYSLEPPRRGVLTSIHNLCFWAEIIKIMYTPVNPSFTV